MTFFQRLTRYLFGVGLGIVVVYIFFKDRDLDSWTPEERVLGALKDMKFEISEKAGCEAQCLGLPENWKDDFLNNAEVIFSKSEARKEPCPVYLLESKIVDQEISINVEVCWDEKARLLSVESSELECDCN